MLSTKFIFGIAVIVIQLISLSISGGKEFFRFYIEIDWIYIFDFKFLQFHMLKYFIADWNRIEKPCLCKEFRCNDGVDCLKAGKVLIFKLFWDFT